MGLIDTQNYGLPVHGTQYGQNIALNVALSGSSVISSDNSSTTALNDSQTFTGEWEDVGHLNSLVVAVATDQNGILTIEFSPDGTNIDSNLTRYYNTARINPPHRFTITRRYARVKFENNSGSNQTYFRLQTLFGDKEQLNIPIDSVMSQNFDAWATRPSDFRYEVALGLRQGVFTWNKFGFNDDVDVGTEVVASFGGSFTYLTSASTLTIVSSDAADDDGSTGANSIVIQGIDSNREAQTEIVTMDGTNSVVTTSTWLGIRRAAVYLAGSGEGNAGNITISATTGGSIQAYIPAGVGVTQQCIFFVQAGHKAVADWLTLNAEKISGGGNPKVTFKGWVFSPVSNCKYEVFREVIDTQDRTRVEMRPSQPFIFNEKDVFWIEATSDTANTIVNGRFSLIEFRDLDA